LHQSSGEPGKRIPRDTEECVKFLEEINRNLESGNISEEESEELERALGSLKR